MDEQESLQIEIIRVFCIISMMWVHVSPGLSIPSVVNGGAFDWLGDILGHTLGRVGVTTLSFLSGFLLWQSRRSRSISGIIGRRFGAVVVPMLTWSAIFLILAVSKEIVFARPSTALREISGDPRGLIDAWSGLAGPMANASLFFLRDLFAATVLLCLAGPLFDRVPLLVVATVLAATIAQVTAPIIFRPSILFFMILGAWANLSGLTISALSRPKLALTAGFILIATEIALAHIGDLGNAPILRTIDLLRRGAVGAFVLVLTGTGMKLLPLGPVARLGRHSFLAYLAHVSVIGILWLFWESYVGDQTVDSYLLFYLVAPFATFAMAVVAGNMLDQAVPALQLLLRGRIGANPPVEARRLQ